MTLSSKGENNNKMYKKDRAGLIIPFGGFPWGTRRLPTRPNLLNVTLTNSTTKLTKL